MALQVLHIHCRHGDGDFSKFEFFSHHYDRVDLSTLDISVVKDYAMHMSVSSWRMLNPVQGKSLNEAREEFGLRDEL